MARCTGSRACSTEGVIHTNLARRITRMAIEDIGLADPRAMQFSLDAWQSYERLGSPEGELALAEAVVYLAVARKATPPTRRSMRRARRRALWLARGAAAIS